MYRLGEREQRHRKTYLWLLGFGALLIAAIIIATHMLQPNTQIAAPPPVITTKVNYDTPQIVTYTQPLLTISLPAGWKPVTRNSDVPMPTYTWQGSVKEDANRWISVYIDANVVNFAVNRELQVQGNGSTLNVLSAVSDNCTTFTGAAPASGRGSTAAKWGGIDFLCDSGNYGRDVVGIVSSDGLNNVNLSGTKGTHKVFFTYTDNSANPDYSIFTDALKNLHMN